MAQQHLSIFDGPGCTFTEEEQSNIELIRRYRAVPVSERAPFLAPDFVRHRAGFAHLAELFGGSGKVEDDSMPDREFVLLDVTAKQDRVWAIWRVVGTHTGELSGIPPTGRRVDVTEVGLWRCEDGLIAEAWFFADDLGLLRQLDVAVPRG